MNKLEKLGSKIVSQMVDRSQYGWPPCCVGILYQPSRPNAVSSENRAFGHSEDATSHVEADKSKD